MDTVFVVVWKSQGKPVYGGEWYVFVDRGNIILLVRGGLHGG